MLRQQVIRVARINTRPVQRSFSAAALRAAAGDTGSTRPGGQVQGDSFTKREAAAENKFIREKEMESLRKLKEKLSVQRQHLDELDKHIKELEKDSGGEQH